jgi:CHAD domain-containing protein
VSIRRLETAYQILSKNVSKNHNMKEYVKQVKELFKLNAKIRDFDIICASMESKYQDKTRELVSGLKNQRLDLIKDANHLAKKISCFDIPEVSKSNIKKSKLEKRYLKVIDRIIFDIHKNSIISLGDEKKIDELHMLRKNFKRLRYSLELASYKKTTQDMLQSLRNIQDILGEIHDSDIIIEHLRNTDPTRYSDIISSEVLHRSKRYNAFVSAFKKDPKAINFNL